MDALQLVPMTTDDVDQVYAIERECFMSPWPRGSFNYELSNPRAYNLCAKQGPTVLGYLMGWCIEPEFHLGNLAVAAAHRRQGVAARLLEQVLAELAARRYETVTLEVREHNRAAIRLYTGYGFVPVAIRKKYYTDTGENAIIMVHTITAPIVLAPSAGTLAAVAGGRP
jgi:ribosomal-protein-alanine N-acetyltransferase